MVVQAGTPDRAVGVHYGVGTQVDLGRGEFLDQGAEGVGAGEAGDLVAELEVFQDFLHVGRESVQVSREIGRQLLAIGPRPEVAQGEPGGVVEGLTGCLAKGEILIHDARFVEHRLGVQHFLLRVLQHRVQPA